MTSKKYDFSGRVALVTGSTSGIGKAIALQLAKCGAQVVITGHLENEVNSTSNEIQNITGSKPLAFLGDLTDDQFATKLVQSTIDQHGRLDILINNAGRACVNGHLGDPDFMKRYEEIYGLNVRAMFLMINLAMPHLAKTKGCIVNTCSYSAFRPEVNPIYCCSKAAVNMITMSAAQELAEKGIRVNAVSPGIIKTQIGRSLGAEKLFEQEAFLSRVQNQTLMKRLGDPNEVANLVLFLCSDDASYITGSNYLIDGGMFCR